MRRGDNIPPVSDYAHWNEDAYAMWYEENKYDMMYADEEIEDDDEYGSDRYYYEPDPDIEFEFDTEEEAREFMDRPQDWGYPEPHSLSMRYYEVLNKWCIEGWSKELGEKAVEINRKARYHG